MNKIHSDTKVIVYQLLSDDLKTESEDKCVKMLTNLVRDTKHRHTGAKIIISLPTNRSDSEDFNNKTDLINAHVKRLFAKDDKVSVCDNSNLSYRGQPSIKHIQDDGVHPTHSGERILFNNIRSVVEHAFSR